MSEKFSLLDPRFSIKNSIGGFVSSERRGFSQTKHGFSTLFVFKLSASVILKSLKSGRISIGFGFFKDFFFSFFFSKMERVFNIGEILTNPLSKLILIDPLNWKKETKPSLGIIQSCREGKQGQHIQKISSLLKHKVGVSD